MRKRIIIWYRAACTSCVGSGSGSGSGYSVRLHVVFGFGFGVLRDQAHVGATAACIGDDPPRIWPVIMPGIATSLLTSRQGWYPREGGLALSLVCVRLLCVSVCLSLSV